MLNDYNLSRDKSFSVIGLYRQNHVFEEKEETYGLNYISDALFYNLLCDILPADTEIHSQTYYAYSEFTVKCLSNEKNSVLKKINVLLSNIDIDELRLDLIKQDIIIRIENSDSGFSIDDFFDKEYYGNNRLTIDVFGNVNSIEKISHNQVCDYIYNSYNAENFLVCICDSDSYELIKPKNTSRFNLKLPDKFTSRNEFDVLCFFEKWKYSDVIISFDCPLHLLDYPYIVELLCCSLEKELLPKDGKVFVEKPKLELDYGVPRVVFRLSASRYKIKNVLNLFFETILSKELKNIDIAKSEIISNYKNIIDDPYLMNCFLGWNYFTGEKYDISVFNNVQYKELISKITFEQLEEVRRTLFKKKNLSVVVVGKIRDLNFEKVFQAFGKDRGRLA